MARRRRPAPGVRQAAERFRRNIAKIGFEVTGAERTGRGATITIGRIGAQPASCPACGGAALVRAEGRITCSTCGWVR